MTETKETPQTHFSLVLETIDITLEDEKGTEEYFLRELSGGDRNSYMKKVGGNIKFGTDGKPVGFTAPEGIQTHLVSLSLHYKESGKVVPLKKIEEFPNRVVESLFDMAEDLSAIDKEEAVEEVGND